MSRLAPGVQLQSNDCMVAAKDDSIILIIYGFLFCCLLEANVWYRCLWYLYGFVFLSFLCLLTQYFVTAIHQCKVFIHVIIFQMAVHGCTFPFSSIHLGSWLLTITSTCFAEWTNQELFFFSITTTIMLIITTFILYRVNHIETQLSSSAYVESKEEMTTEEGI